MPIRNAEKTVEVVTTNERGIAGRAEFGDPRRTGEWHPHLSLGWLGDREDEYGIVRIGFADLGAISGRQATENGLTVEGAHATASMGLPRPDLVEFDLTLAVAQLTRYRSGSEIRLPYDVTGGRDAQWNYQTPLLNQTVDGGIITGNDPETGEQVTRPEWADGSYAVYSSTIRMDRLAGNGFAARPAGTGKICHVRRPYVTDSFTGETLWGNLDLQADQLTLVFDATWFTGRTGPFVVDPDVGYTTIGASNLDCTDRRQAFGAYAMPEDGDATSVSVYVASSGDATFGIWDDDGTQSEGTTLLRDTAGGSTTGSTWNERSLDSNLSISSGAYTWIGLEADSGTIKYDSSGTRSREDSITYSSGTCSDFGSPSSSTIQGSCYFTYTATGGGGGGNPAYYYAQQ